MTWVTSWRTGLALWSWAGWLMASSHALTFRDPEEQRAAGRFQQHLRGWLFFPHLFAKTRWALNIAQSPQQGSAGWHLPGVVRRNRTERSGHRILQILGGCPCPSSSPHPLRPSSMSACFQATNSSSELTRRPREQGWSAIPAEEVSTWRGCTMKSTINGPPPPPALPRLGLQWAVFRAVMWWAVDMTESLSAHRVWAVSLRGLSPPVGTLAAHIEQGFLMLRSTCSLSSPGKPPTSTVLPCRPALV